MRGKGPGGHARDELSHVAKLKNIPRLDPRRFVVIFNLQDPPSVDPRLDTGVVSLSVSTKICIDLVIDDEEASFQDRMVRLLQVLELELEPCLHGRLVLTCSR